eukprot:scaffold282464_cov19-Tisochrysis_lutea.AAC.1
MSSFLGQEQGEGKLFGSRDSHYVAKSVSNISDSERRLQPRGSGRSPGCAAEQKTRGEALSGSEAQGCWLSFMLQQLMGCWLSFMLQQLRAEFNANDWIPSYGAHTTLEYYTLKMDDLRPNRSCLNRGGSQSSAVRGIGEGDRAQVDLLQPMPN